MNSAFVKVSVINTKNVRCFKIHHLRPGFTILLNCSIIKKNLTEFARTQKIASKGHCRWHTII